MNFNGPADTPSRTPLLGRAWCVRLPPRTARSAERFGRRAACPHAAMTGCIGESRTRLRTHAPLRTRYRSSRRGRCPHRPAVPVGIRAGGDQGLTIPQSRCASQLPLHKGACPLRRRGLATFGDGASDPAVRAAASRPYGPAIGLLVGADAHIGPPAAACNALCRPHPPKKASPW